MKTVVSLLLVMTAAGPSSPASNDPVPPEDSALPVVREMLRSNLPASRIEGIEMLEGVSSMASADIKLKALRDPDPAVRERAIRGLAAFPNDQLCARIVEDLRKGSAAELTALEQALPALRAKIENPLLDMLRDPDLKREQRVIAAYALGHTRSTLATEALAAVVWQDDRVLALTCVQALARAADPKALPYLRSMLGHKSEDVRWEVVHALGAQRGLEALDALVTVAVSTQETTPMIKRQAILCLGQSDDPDAIPLLIRCMEYSHTLRDVSGEALRELTGKRYGGSPLEWRRWYEEQRRVAQSPRELLASYQRNHVPQQQQSQLLGEFVFETE
jgi:hypothetical protein